MTGHIGTDSLQKPGDPISTFFNWSICDLTQIKTLCITGANFNDLDTHAMRGRGRMAALEELKLLNCRMSPDEMVTMIESAASLKKVTIRGPNCSDPDGEQDAQYTEVSGVLEEYFSGSLEELDIDIYWGTPSAMCLHAMRSLKKLTVTMYTLLGSLNDDPRLKLYEIVPQSLETLVVRHEAGITLPFHQVHEALFEGKLPNLRSMVFQIPENIRVSPTTPSLQRRAQDFVSQFHSMGVELQVCLVPYPTVIGGYDACPCECLEVYHRFPFHPWGDSGFAYDDCSDDADMYEEEEDDESEGESTGEDGESESSENDGSGEESQEQGERGIPFLEDLGARCDTVIDTHEEYLRWVDGSK